MPGFDAGHLDETIHGRLRLGVMAYLATASPSSFTELATALEATNGNLLVHLRKLEEAGYVHLDKVGGDGRPSTRVVLTEEGRAAWSRYLDALKPLFG